MSLKWRRSKRQPFCLQFSCHFFCIAHYISVKKVVTFSKKLWSGYYDVKCAINYVLKTYRGRLHLPERLKQNWLAILTRGNVLSELNLVDKTCQILLFKIRMTLDLKMRYPLYASGTLDVAFINRRFI